MPKLNDTIKEIKLTCQPHGPTFLFVCSDNLDTTIELNRDLSFSILKVLIRHHIRLKLTDLKKDWGVGLFWLLAFLASSGLFLYWIHYSII